MGLTASISDLQDKYYIVTQLATGGELFDRICEYGKFTEKDASQVVREILTAVDYLHKNNIVHRDLKPENLLYLTPEANSSLVLADFGIAKMLDNEEVLTTMAGSFGYAAPEVMMKKGHGKAVDLWSLGVITYTLLCGYSPFRSDSMADLIEECSNGRVIFHERYWKDVSKDAKSFISALLQPEPEDRPSSSVRYPFLTLLLEHPIDHTHALQEALKHTWLKGETASDKDILPEIKSYMAKARLRRGIEMVKLANRIEALRLREDDPEGGDLPSNTEQAAREGVTAAGVTEPEGSSDGTPRGARRLSRAARTAIFREVVLAKVREMKAEEEKTVVERTATEKKAGVGEEKSN